MTGTPSRTARVLTVRWDLKEAEGKLPPRGTRTAWEALSRGRGSVGVQSPMSSGTRRGICGGDGRKVTRLTLGALSICLVLGKLKGLSMGGQKSAEGNKDRRSDPRPEHVNPARCHNLVSRRRRCHAS
jgi:hypothetical protein